MSTRNVSEPLDSYDRAIICNLLRHTDLLAEHIAIALEHPHTHPALKAALCLISLILDNINLSLRYFSQ